MKKNLEKLHKTIKQNAKSNSHIDEEQFNGNQFADQDKQIEDIIQRRYCCLATTIGFLITLLILLITAYYWKLLNMNN